MAWDSLPSGEVQLWCAVCGTIQPVTVAFTSAIDSLNGTQHSGQLNGNPIYECVNPDCQSTNYLNITIYAVEPVS